MVTTWNRSLRAMLWKNWLLSHQQKLIILVEMFVPVLVFGLMTCTLSVDNGKVVQNSTNNTTTPPVMDMKMVRSYLPRELDIWYAPTEHLHQQIIQLVGVRLKLKPTSLLSFDSNEELLTTFRRLYNGQNNIFIITFEDDISHNLVYNISIYRQYVTWNTSNLYRDASSLGNNVYNPYLHEGFLALQIVIDTVFTEVITGKHVNVRLQEIPAPTAIAPQLHRSSGNVVPLAIIISFGAIHFFSLRRGMLYEENSGLNDVMKASGVKLWVILVGWLIQRTAITMLPCLLSALLIANIASVLSIAKVAMLMGILLSYNMTTIISQLFMSCLAQKSNGVYLGGSCLWLLSYLLVNFSSVNKMSAYVFSNVALNLAYNAIVDENYGELKFVWLQFLTNAALTFAASLFVDSVNKRDLQSLKTFFSSLSGSHPRTNSVKSDRVELGSDSGQTERLFSQRPAVVIRNLQKKYGVSVALDIAHVELPENRVTVVLGANGAGKSTLAWIVAGMIKSYSGSVDLNFSDSSVGFCGPTNVLFWDLTVEQNVQLFAKIRSTSWREESDRILDKMEMTGSRTKKPNEISSGVRRCICLAMALVGEPQMIILDEPTRGLNLKSKYAMREQLSTTTLVVTHSRTEADILTDNLIILNKGRILTQGTYEQIHANFGPQITLSMNDLPDVKTMKQSVETQDDFKEVQISRIIGTQLVLQCNRTTNVKNILCKLESMKDAWNIKKISYNLNGLTHFLTQHLEESKMQNTTEEDEHVRSMILEAQITELGRKFENRNYGYKMAVLMKRIFFSQRQIIWFAAGLLAVYFFVAFALFVSLPHLRYYKYNEEYLPMLLNVYNGTEAFVIGNDTPDICKYYKSLDKSYNGSIKEYENISQAMSALSIRSIVGAEFIKHNKSEFSVTVFFSELAIHSAPIAVNLVMNAIIRSLVGEEYFISVTNKPVGKQRPDFLLSEIRDEYVINVWSVLIPTGLLFLLVNYIVFPFIESTKDLRRFQIFNGTRFCIYWMVNFLFDSFLSLIASVVLLVLLIIFSEYSHLGTFLESTECIAIFVIFFVSASVQIPICYVSSTRSRYKFHTFCTFIFFALCTGTLPTLVANTFDSMEPVHDLIWILGIFPSFTGGFLFFNFIHKFIDNHNWRNMNPREKRIFCMTHPDPCCESDSLQCIQHQSYFKNSNYGITAPILWSLVGISIWHFLLILISTYTETYDNKKKNNAELELSTTNDQNEMSKMVLYVKELTVAQLPRFLTLTFKSNMIYGLRGDNDSGKTTYFNILGKGSNKKKFTGQVYIDDKRISVLNRTHNKRIDIWDKEYNSMVGYCSFKSDLNHYLTGLEFLILNGLSRGYDVSTSRRAAKILISIFDLDWAGTKKILANLSSGNQKRLQICSVLMGFPDFVFIDDFSKFLDITRYERLSKFLSAYRKITQKSIIMSLLYGSPYISLCDKIINIDKGDARDEDNPLPVHTLILRTVKSMNQSSQLDFITDIEAEFKSKVEDEVRVLFSCCYAVVVVGENTITSLFEKAERLRVKGEIVHFSITSGNTLVKPT